MTIQIRPLGKIRDIVQSTGFDIAYAYDDLVFSENSIFVIRFDEKDMEKLHLYFNVDCHKAESDIIEHRLKVACKIAEFDIVNVAKFSVKQLEGKEELELNFIEG
jgi:hypothetical protein